MRIVIISPKYHCLCSLCMSTHANKRKLFGIINPRLHACAARVIVVGLRVSWGAIFSVRGEKGGGGGFCILGEGD